MNPINLLPMRERLWQRQRRWWRQRWTWTLGISLAVWAGLAGLLAWHHQRWVDANAQLQAQIEAQAPVRAQHQRLLQALRQWQAALQHSANQEAAKPEPWHTWQALAQMAAPQVRWERWVWDGQSITASGQVLQASVATQLQTQWQQRWGPDQLVETLSLKAEQTLDPEGVADTWWHGEWRWRAPAAGGTPALKPTTPGVATMPPLGRSPVTEGLRP